MTVAAMITAHVTSPALMAIGIRHLAELSCQAFSSIWVARPLSAMKTALPYMRAAAIAGDSAPMTVSDTSVPVLQPIAQSAFKFADLGQSFLVF